MLAGCGRELGGEARDHQANWSSSLIGCGAVRETLPPLRVCSVLTESSKHAITTGSRTYGPVFSARAFIHKRRLTCATVSSLLAALFSRPIVVSRLLQLSIRPDRVLSRPIDYGRFLATPEKRNNSGIDQISTSAGKQPCHGHFTAMPKFCRSSAILGVF